MMPTDKDRAFGAGYQQASDAGGMVIDHLGRRLREAEIQRDELLEALSDTLNMLRAAHIQCGIHHDGNKRVIKARAAVAKARGTGAVVSAVTERNDG